MHCAYHPKIEAAGTCGGCHKPLCTDCADATGQCSVCAARGAANDFQLADRERVVQMEAREIQSKRLARLRTAALWGLLGVCVAATGWQLPAAVSSIKAGHKPLRVGTYHTDAGTDACIVNLWIVSRLLQEGKPPAGSVVCPVSDLAYVPRTVADDRVYDCPQPGRHGLRSLRVSRRKPVPEVNR